MKDNDERSGLLRLGSTAFARPRSEAMDRAARTVVCHAGPALEPREAPRRGGAPGKKMGEGDGSGDTIKRGRFLREPPKASRLIAAEAARLQASCRLRSAIIFDHSPESALA